MRQLYKENKRRKVGEKCICPSCGTSFIKTHYQQAFCKSKVGTVCKDKYWNTVTPQKRNNTTRISPASEAWMEERRRCITSHEPYEHPYSEGAHGQE